MSYWKNPGKGVQGGGSIEVFCHQVSRRVHSRGGRSSTRPRSYHKGCGGWREGNSSLKSLGQEGEKMAPKGVLGSALHVRENLLHGGRRYSGDCNLRKERSR